MKICYKIKSYPHSSETFIDHNIIQTKRSGAKVCILTDHYLGLKNSSQYNFLLENNINKVVIEGVKNQRKGFLKLLFICKIILKNPRMVMHFRRIMSMVLNDQSFEPIYDFANMNSLAESDLLHVHYHTSLGYVNDFIAMGWLKTPIVVTFHGFDAYAESEKEFKKRYTDFYNNWVNAVAVNSTYFKSELLKLGIKQQKIHVVPLGIDTTFYQGTPKEISPGRSVKFLSVGRLVQWKGHMYALEVIKKLKDQGLKISYNIIGEGREFHSLILKIKELGLEQEVKLLGKKRQEQIKNYLEDADIFLLPSTYDDIKKRRETFGVVSLEAQSMGLPIVGFNSGGFPETIIDGETGFLVPDRDVNAMANKVKLLIEQPKLYCEMSRKAIGHVQKNFDIEVTNKRYIDLYNELYRTAK